MDGSYSSLRRSKGKPLQLIRIFLWSISIVAVVVFVLPFTQHLMNVKERKTVRSIDIALPPPPPPPPEPPPPQEEQPQESKPELKQNPKPLSLSQLQLALNPGTGGSMGAAFGVGGFEVETDALKDMNTFSISELDEKPRVVRKPNWSWPRSAIGKIQNDVRARILVVITEDGRVKFQRFVQLTERIIESELVEYVEKFRFTQPKREGKVVKARFLFPMELAKP